MKSCVIFTLKQTLRLLCLGQNRSQTFVFSWGVGVCVTRERGFCIIRAACLGRWVYRTVRLAPGTDDREGRGYSATCKVWQNDLKWTVSKRRWQGLGSSSGSGLALRRVLWSDLASLGLRFCACQRGTNSAWRITQFHSPLFCDPEAERDWVLCKRMVFTPHFWWHCCGV